MAQGPSTTTIEKLVTSAIQQYRSKLLDLSTRNPLISFRHSDRSRSHIRVVDEIPEKLFLKLEAGRQLIFEPVPEPQTWPSDESFPLFVDALQSAKRNDQQYQAALTALGPNPSDRQNRKVERELRDRLRLELGLSPFVSAKDARHRAVELGINTEYDLPRYDGQNARRFNDLKIQTLLFQEDLQKKLGALREAARVLLQDAGLSALYCAFGFLEYYDSTQSDERKVAPLVFYPVTLDRELVWGEYRYFIQGTNDEIEINVALRELLRQCGFELPAWIESENEGNSLEDYFAQIESLIKTRPDWKLRRYVTLGLFTFSTLALYKDLDPDKWASRTTLQQNELIRTLIAGAEVHGSGVASDYEIDTLSTPEPLFITDADSSQHSAVVDVLTGRNCVIQGPPGTGKSQTITNLIAAAMEQGKSVLFVAEKMAALEVVKNRLAAAGLDTFCLELHSSKTSKTAVVQSLANRLEYRPPRMGSDEMQNNLEAIRRARAELIQYVQRANEPAGKTGLKVRDILLGSATRDRVRVKLPPTISSARFADALSITPQLRNEMLSAASNLEEQMGPITGQGRLADHAWRGLQNSEITELEREQLLASLKAWESKLNAVAEVVAVASRNTGGAWPETEEELRCLSSVILSLPQADGTVRAETFQLLGCASARERLRAAIVALETRAQQESKLKGVFSDMGSAIAVGSQRIQGACDTLTVLKLRDHTVSGLRKLAASLKARCTDLVEVGQAISMFHRTFGQADHSINAARAGCAGVDLLRSIPRQLWFEREPAVLEEGNAELLRGFAEFSSTLTRRRGALSGAFDLSVLPEAAELRRLGAALRSANFITALFKRECRQARNVFRAMLRVRRKVSRLEVADALLSCAIYLDDEHRFLNDADVKRVCGRHFKGLSTSFGLLRQLNSWGTAVSQRLAPFGHFGRLVRDFLFAAPADQLDLLNASASGSSYEALLRVLCEVSDADAENCSFGEMAAREEERYLVLIGAISTLEKAAVGESLTVGELANLLGSLGNIEKQIHALEADPITRAMIGGSAQAGMINLEALNSTLAFANLIITADLPRELTSYLFGEIGRVNVLRVTAESLKRELDKLQEVARTADVLARFDPKLWSGETAFEVARISSLASRCRSAALEADSLEDYVNFLLAEEVARDAALGPVLTAFTEAREDYHNLVHATEFVFFRSAAEQILNSDPRLKSHSGSTHQQLRRRYQDLDREYLRLQRQRLAKALADKIPPEGNCVGRVADLSEMALVRHVSGQTRPRIPLREVLRRAGAAIKVLKPCWMMSPMSIAQFLEPGALQFDLLVMDEASQIRPEEALGAIARVRQMVVVGDKMQLPPTPFFQKLSSGGVTDSEEEEDVDVKQESILETAEARFFPPRRLKWHYRSEHGSLISFSNAEFYNHQLTVFPSPSHDHPDYGVKLVSVAGIYGSGVNQAEATAVIEAAGKFMKDSPEHSLGIVAVNSKQTELIREHLDRLFATDPSAEAYRAKWEKRNEGLESVFVKNLENVQGDERDVVFISTVYGKDETGNFYQRFGPINSAYGHRRLNVLFTRAKKRVVVFTSMMPENIVDDGKHWGVRVLKSYLRYARDGQALLATAAGSECDNEFEQWILETLKANGYEAIPQLGFAGYRIDMAVRHPKKPGTFICGIECDGAMYHSALSVRERDRLRQEVLERLGWKIYRIWSTDWFRNPSLQTKNLLAYLRQLTESFETTLSQ